MSNDLKARLTHAAWCGDILADGLCKEAADRIAELERKHREKVQAIGKLEDDEQAAERRAEAAEAKCERLRADRDQANESWHYANGVAELAMKHRDEAEAECERLRAALQEARDTLRDDRIGTTRMDDPNLYQRIWAAADKADTALTADQQGERENGMADVSWERQLERTRDDVWNAALEEAAVWCDKRAEEHAHHPLSDYHVTSEWQAETIATAIRNLKRGTS